MTMMMMIAQMNHIRNYFLKLLLPSPSTLCIDDMFCEALKKTTADEEVEIINKMESVMRGELV